MRHLLAFCIKYDRDVLIRREIYKLSKNQAFLFLISLSEVSDTLCSFV